MPRVRRSAHVFIASEGSGGEPAAYSPLTGVRTKLSAEEVADLLRIPVDRFVSPVGDRIPELCSRGLLLNDASDPVSVELRRREEAISALEWDSQALCFRLASRWEGIRDSLPPEPVETSPPAFSEIPDVLETLPLDLDDEPSSELYELLRSRRTWRDFRPGESISIEQLSRLLRYVWGAHGHRRDLRGVSVVKKTSPSGGSLHPAEVYPVVANVEGVAPGVYHYSVRDHALDLLEALEREAVVKLANEFTAGQDYFENAPVLFVMTARFERLFSKYRRDRAAYHVALLDAGHLSQTFYLVCTELGLGPFVTAAVNHAEIDNRLGLDPYREGTLCICGCGLPGARPSDLNPEVFPYVPRETRLGTP